MASEHSPPAAFGAELENPIRRASTQHNEQQKARKDDILGVPCQTWDIRCLCSEASLDRVLYSTQDCSSVLGVIGAGGLSTSDPIIFNPLPPPITQPFIPRPSNTPATPRTRSSSPNPTSTASSSRSPTLSTTGASDGGSGGNRATTSSASLSSSTGATEDDSTSLSSISSPIIPITSGSSLNPSPLSSGAVSSVSPPQSSGPHHLNTGAIVGIVLGALVALLASAIALFLLRRRARRRGRSKSKHTSVESSESRQRLEACSYSDGTSRPASSVLTLGSALTPGGPDYDYESKREPGGHSSAPTETRPLAGDASVHSLHEGVLNVPAPFGPDAPSASPELLALTRTDFAMGNALNLNDGGGGGGLRRSVSGLSRMTTSSRDVQSVEAL